MLGESTSGVMFVLPVHPSNLQHLAAATVSPDFARPLSVMVHIVHLDHLLTTY